MRMLMNSYIRIQPNLPKIPPQTLDFLMNPDEIAAMYPCFTQERWRSPRQICQGLDRGAFGTGKIPDWRRATPVRRPNSCSSEEPLDAVALPLSQGMQALSVEYPGQMLWPIVQLDRLTPVSPLELKNMVIRVDGNPRDPKGIGDNGAVHGLAEHDP
jgi:hypothetical protein